MKRKEPESCSAERPAPKVAYIDCPNESCSRSPTAVAESIQHAVGVGATIINMTFDRPATNLSGAGGHLSLSWCILKTAWGGFSIHKAGNVLSLFASAHWDLVEKTELDDLVDETELDPEDSSPALVLTLRERVMGAPMRPPGMPPMMPVGSCKGPTVRMSEPPPGYKGPTISPASVVQPAPPGLLLSVVTVSWPSLPIPLKDRLLKAYVDKAVQSGSHAVLIGGVFSRLDGSLLWLENRVNKLNFNIRVAANKHLCILPWCETGKMDCIALDTAGPYAVVIEHEPSSAARPAPSTPTHHTHQTHRSSSAARPAALPRGSSSAERPAASPGAVLRPAPPKQPPPRRIMLKAATPLYDNLLHDLQHTAEASALMGWIEQNCFKDKLRFVTSAGTCVPEAIPFSCKMESLILVALTQRQKIAIAAGLTETQLQRHKATPEQMKDMMNNWRKDVTSWMSTENQHWYNQLLRWNRVQQAHQLTKTCGTWTLIGMDSL